MHRWITSNKIMGEYYDWVNVDKKEYISPNDFDYGNKRAESSYKGNDFLCALRELLSDKWRGDRILFLGDEITIPENTTNEVLQVLYVHTIEYGEPGNAPDMVFETYRNISGLFKQAEEEVRREIGFYLEEVKNDDLSATNEYGINIEKPFEGLFLKMGKDFRYTINHSKKVYYSLRETKILNENGKKNNHIDPLPFLMSYGRMVNEPAPWVGDIIGVSDSKPGGYELLKEIQLDW